MGQAETARVRRAFERSFDVLPAMFAFVQEFASAAEPDPAALTAVELAVEELFTNLVKYDGGRGDIELELERTAETLRVTLVGRDGRPFDVTAVPDARTDLPLDQRRPGGLGIHLVRRMVDRFEYRFENGTSRTMIEKSLR